MLAKHALKLFGLAVIFITAATLAQQPSPTTKVESKATPVAASATQGDGPFGFEYGMTRQQVIDKVGKDSVMQDSGGTLIFNTAPKPHPDFQFYGAVFSPEKGLLKVIAISKHIETSEDGSELRAKYNYVRDALRAKYGKPDNEFDLCKGNDVECQSQFFMMELLDKNRVMSSFWTTTHTALPSHINAINLEIQAFDLHKGSVNLSYEFDGWEAFVKDQNKKRDSAF